MKTPMSWAFTWLNQACVFIYRDCFSNFKSVCECGGGAKQHNLKWEFTELDSQWCAGNMTFLQMDPSLDPEGDLNYIYIYMTVLTEYCALSTIPGWTESLSLHLQTSVTHCSWSCSVAKGSTLAQGCVTNCKFIKDYNKETKKIK